MKKITVSILFSLSCLLLTGQVIPCVNPTPPDPGNGRGIINVTLGILNHTTPTDEGFTVEYDSAGTVIPDLGRCETYVLTVTNALSDQSMVWIDWNADGDFYDPGESYLPNTVNVNQFLYNIDVPFDAAIGNKIMRIGGGRIIDTDPCSVNSSFCDFEDYRINVVENNMQIDSIVVEQITSCFSPNENCLPILRIAIHTTGIINPVTITGFNFSSNGSTDPISDISDASVIFIGDTSNLFSCNTVFGTLGTAPVGGFNITGNQILTPSSCRNIHYFWLTYDITSGATASNLIDAECIDVTTTGGPPVIIPLVTNPMGNSTINSGIEICDNGLDDDCDGLIDCFDPDCAGIGDCISESTNFFYGFPSDTCPVPPFSEPNSSIFKEWTFEYTDPSGHAVVVGDLDGDNIAEIVITSSTTNLAVLDGQTGLIKRNVPGTNYNNSHGVIADTDGNGFGEIYWTNINNLELFCYDYGTDAILWGPIAYSNRIDRSLSIADLNGDGISELYTDLYIINSTNGDIMGEFPNTTNQRPIAIDVLPNDYCPECSGLEVVIGTQIFTVTINGGTAIIDEIFSFETDPTFSQLPIGPARTGVRGRITTAADLNNDNLLDLVTTTSDMLISWDPRTLTIIDSVSFKTLPFLNLTNNSSFVTTAVSIDDIDNDGDLDFVFSIIPSASFSLDEVFLFALDNNFNFLWAQPKLFDSSTSSIPTIFDLNGDGIKEIIFRPESTPTFENWHIYILDAMSGNRLDSIYCLNGTLFTGVGTIVADVDDDGEVEIITNGNPNPNNPGFAELELMVIGSRETQWVCGRNVWNQHNCHPSFVNDDLTIPQHQQNHGAVATINTWGNQTAFKDTSGNYYCPLPDLNVNIDSVFNITCDTAGVDITVCNVGRKSIQEVTKYISFYNGDPLAGGILIKTDTLGDQPDTVGSCFSFNTTVYAESHPFDLYVVVNDSGSNPLSVPNIKLKECILNNNFDNAIPTNFILVADTITICEGDSVFLNNTFQTMAGVYSDTTQNMGCDSIISTTLILTPRPNPSISPQDPMCLNENPVELVVTDTGGTWIGSGIADSINGIFSPQLAEVGINAVYYITTCGDSVGIEIIVDVCDLFIPNTFTPNGDNTNDTFFPEGSDISEIDYLFNIFDRWGQLIFKSQIPGEGWDGKFKGKIVTNDVYIWQLSYRDSNNKLQKITGRVNVIR